MGRTENTQRRRREILQAALACFHVLGYEKTTLADICQHSKASIGSIYHLFESKERIFAALYLEAISESQASSMRALKRARNLEDGIRALVRSHLRWVSRNRELAGYLLTMRRAECMNEAESKLERLNVAFRNALRTWLEDSQAERERPAIGMDMLLAILVGPSQDFARRWLSGKTTISLRDASDVLAEAAWLSLRGLRDSQNSTESI